MRDTPPPTPEQTLTRIGDAIASQHDPAEAVRLVVEILHEYGIDTHLEEFH